MHVSLAVAIRCVRMQLLTLTVEEACIFPSR